MKRFKKSLVTLLVLVFVLSIMGTGFAAVTESSTSVVRAKALGILKGDEKGNLNLDKPITRAEAVTLIVRLLGLEKSAELMKGQTQFKDVGASHWASGYINVGVGQGVLNGYPDGTFKPENNVTYAEMAKMLLYAMNYGVTVQGAPWPSGVMSKADDLGIFDGVNAVPNVPAVRGDVVQMIDNSLTIKHLKQTGYGDLKQYEESDTTFLSKMDVKEINGRVTAIDMKDSEITVTPDEDEDDITKATTYKLLDNTIDIESLLGVAVTVWVNDKDEAFFIDPEMDDVKVDVISDVDTTNKEVELKVADETYDLASNVKVYINGAEADLGDLEAGMYGYFVFDEDEIIYVNVKDWNEVEAGVVKEVNDNIITYYEVDGSEEEIDLEDADDGYVILMDGKKITANDIKANDVIYVAEYDDMYHVVVVRNAVSGKLERVKADEVKIAGKTYDVIEGYTTLSPNDNEDIYVYSEDYDTSDSKLDDMLGENTVALLDLAGDVRHLISSVETTSDEYYGILLKVDDYNDKVKVNVNGESVSYDIDADIYNVDGEKITLTQLKELPVNYSNDEYAIVKFTLDKDGVIDELEVYAYGTYDADAKEFSVDGGTEYTITDFDDDDDLIKTEDGVFFVDKDTIIVDDVDDVDVVKWDDIKSKDVGDGVRAVIIDDGKGNAKFVVFTAGFSSIEEDEELGVILDRFKDADGDWAVTVATYGGDTKDIKLESKNDDNAVGNVVTFTLNANGELEVTNVVYSATVVDTVYDDENSPEYVVIGTVAEKGTTSIKLDSNNTYYKVTSKTMVFDITDGLAEIDTAAYRDVKKGSEVVLVVEDNVVKAILIKK